MARTRGHRPRRWTREDAGLIHLKYRTIGNEGGRGGGGEEDGRETEREARGKEAGVRESARARAAAGSACSHLQVPGPSLMGDARPSGGSVDAAPLKRHARVPSARSVAVSCVQTRHRPVLHRSLTADPTTR